MSSSVSAGELYHRTVDVCAQLVEFPTPASLMGAKYQTPMEFRPIHARQSVDAARIWCGTMIAQCHDLSCPSSASMCRRFPALKYLMVTYGERIGLGNSYQLMTQ